MLPGDVFFVSSFIHCALEVYLSWMGESSKFSATADHGLKGAVKRRRTLQFHQWHTLYYIMALYFKLPIIRTCEDSLILEDPNAAGFQRRTLSIIVSTYYGYATSIKEDRYSIPTYCLHPWSVQRLYRLVPIISVPMTRYVSIFRSTSQSLTVYFQISRARSVCGLSLGLRAGNSRGFFGKYLSRNGLEISLCFPTFSHPCRFFPNEALIVMLRRSSVQSFRKQAPINFRFRLPVRLF